MPNPYLDSILSPTPAKPPELEPGVHVFPPAEPAGPPAPPARGLGDYFKSIGFAPERDEVIPFVEAHARLGIPWEDTAAGLRKRFGDGVKPTAVKPQFDLAAAKEEQRGKGVGTVESFTRSYMPFSSALDGTVVGRAVGTKGTAEYAAAKKKFAAGDATKEDIDRIARYERLQEIDQQVGSTFAGKAVQALGGAGQILGEAGVAGKAIGAARVGLLGKAAPAALPPLAAAVNPGLAARLGGKLATTAAVTPLMPSMYAERARQKNMDEGREPDDWRGYPAAVGLAFVNNLVLGSVQKIATNPLARVGKLATATGTGAVGRATAAGVIGAGEQAGVDVATGAVDEFLPKAYRTDTRYGVLGDLARGKGGEAAQHAAIQVLTFAAFAAGHNRAPDKVVDAFKAAVDAADPATVARAAAPLSAAVKANPNITRAEAAKVARTSPEGPVRSYVESLADTLPADAWANENTFGQRENPAGVPEQVKPPERPVAMQTESESAASASVSPAAEPAPDVQTGANRHGVGLLPEAASPEAQPEAQRAQPPPRKKAPLADWSDQDVWDAAVALTGLKSKGTKVNRQRAVQALADAKVPPELLAQFKPKAEVVPPVKPPEAAPRGAEPEPAAEPPAAEIAPPESAAGLSRRDRIARLGKLAEKPPEQLPGLLEAAGLAERVDKLKSDAVAEVGKETAVLPFGDRFVRVDFDPAANEVRLGFGFAEERPGQGERDPVGKSMTRGTTELLRSIGRLAEAAKGKGAAVAYVAEPRRAEFYAGRLERAGFVRERVTDRGDGTSEYRWTPKPTAPKLSPLDRARQAQLQRPTAEAKPPQVLTGRKGRPLPESLPETKAPDFFEGDPERVSQTREERDAEFLAKLGAAELSPLELAVVKAKYAGQTFKGIADTLPEAVKPDGTRYTRARIQQIEAEARKKAGLPESVEEAVVGLNKAERLIAQAEKGEAVDFAELSADPEGAERAINERVSAVERELQDLGTQILKERDREVQRGLKSGLTREAAERRADDLVRAAQAVPANEAEAQPTARAEGSGPVDPAAGGRAGAGAVKARVGKKPAEAPAEPWAAEAAKLARRSRPQLLSMMEKIDPEGVAAGRHATKTPAELAKMIALNRATAGAEADKLRRSEEKQAQELAKRNSKAQLLAWIGEHRPEKVAARAYNAYSNLKLARILIRVRAEAEAQAKEQGKADRELQSKAKAAEEVGSLARTVRGNGGVVFDAEMKKYFESPAEAAEYGFPRSVLVADGKGRGRSIDQMAAELHEQGELPDADPQTLIDMLSGKRAGHGAEVGAVHERGLDDYYRRQQEEADAQAREEAEQEAADRAAAEAHQGEAEFDPTTFDPSTWSEEAFPAPPFRGTEGGDFFRGGVPGNPGGNPAGRGIPREFAHARAEVTRERGERGESPVAAAVRKSNPEAWAEALRAVQADPSASERLVAELERQPRPTTSTENAILLQRRVALANAHDAAARDVIDAPLRRVSPAKLEVLRRKEQDIAAERDRLDRAVAAAGTQLGRGLQFFRQLAAEDYSLGRMLQRAEVAKKAPLTVAERARVGELQKRIEQLEKQLADAEAGGKVPDKGQPGDLTDIKVGRRKGRQEFDTLIDELTRSGQSRPRKVFEAVKDTANLARAFMTSFDLPPVFRQGGFVSLGNPLRAARALGEGVKAIFSTRASDRALQDILDRPNSLNGSYKGGGVEFTDPNGKLSAQEEAFLANRFRFEGLRAKTGLAASERGYTTFLNRLRADTFDALAATVARDGQPTPAELKAIGNAVNVFTGRGNLGSFEKAAVPLAQVFFSPRYLVSRFQTLVGQPLYGGSAATRKAVATEYAKAAVGLGLLYALVKAANSDAEITFDPRSTDFGKIKLGNYRLDPMFGMSQLIVAGTKSIGGAEKSVGTGKVTPLRGPGVPYGGRDVGDVMESFGRGKLAPIPGVGFDLLRGNRIDRKPVTAASEAGGLLLPISWGDVTDAMKDQGVPRGAAVALAALLGMGGQLHEQRQKGQKEPEPLLPVLGDTDQPVRKGRVGKRMEPRF